MSTTTELKRFDPEHGISKYWDDVPPIVMTECSDGEWVRFADVQAYLAGRTAAHGEPSKVGAADAFGPDKAGCCGVTVTKRCEGCPHDRQAGSAEQVSEREAYQEWLDIDNHRLRRTMRKMMARLADLLDEDQFAEFECLISACGVDPQSAALQHTAPAPSKEAISNRSVKTWQERCNWTSREPVTKLMVEAMKGEIAELRALLSAPAQAAQPEYIHDAGWTQMGNVQHPPEGYKTNADGGGEIVPLDTEQAAQSEDSKRLDYLIKEMYCIPNHEERFGKERVVLCIAGDVPFDEVRAAIDAVMSTPREKEPGNG